MSNNEIMLIKQVLLALEARNGPQFRLSQQSYKILVEETKNLLEGPDDGTQGASGTRPPPKKDDEDVWKPLFPPGYNPCIHNPETDRYDDNTAYGTPVTGPDSAECRQLKFGYDQTPNTGDDPPPNLLDPNSDEYKRAYYNAYPELYPGERTEIDFWNPTEEEFRQELEAQQAHYPEFAQFDCPNEWQKWLDRRKMQKLKEKASEKPQSLPGSQGIPKDISVPGMIFMMIQHNLWRPLKNGFLRVVNHGFEASEDIAKEQVTFAVVEMLRSRLLEQEFQTMKMLTIAAEQKTADVEGRPVDQEALEAKYEELQLQLRRRNQGIVGKSKEWCYTEEFRALISTGRPWKTGQAEQWVKSEEGKGYSQEIRTQALIDDKVQERMGSIKNIVASPEWPMLSKTVGSNLYLKKMGGSYKHGKNKHSSNIIIPDLREKLEKALDMMFQGNPDVEPGDMEPWSPSWIMECMKHLVSELSEENLLDGIGPWDWNILVAGGLFASSTPKTKRRFKPEQFVSIYELYKASRWISKVITTEIINYHDDTPEVILDPESDTEKYIHAPGRDNNLTGERAKRFGWMKDERKINRTPRSLKYIFREDEDGSITNGAIKSNHPMTGGGGWLHAGNLYSRHKNPDEELETEKENLFGDVEGDFWGNFRDSRLDSWPPELLFGCEKTIDDRGTPNTDDDIQSCVGDRGQNYKNRGPVEPDESPMMNRFSSEKDAVLAAAGIEMPEYTPLHTLRLEDDEDLRLSGEFKEPQQRYRKKFRILPRRPAGTAKESIEQDIEILVDEEARKIIYENWFDDIADAAGRAKSWYDKTPQARMHRAKEDFKKYQAIKRSDSAADTLRGGWAGALQLNRHPDDVDQVYTTPWRAWRLSRFQRPRAWKGKRQTTAEPEDYQGPSIGTPVTKKQRRFVNKRVAEFELWDKEVFDPMLYTVLRLNDRIKELPHMPKGNIRLGRNASEETKRKFGLAQDRKRLVKKREKILSQMKSMLAAQEANYHKDLGPLDPTSGNYDPERAEGKIIAPDSPEGAIAQGGKKSEKATRLEAIRRNIRRAKKSKVEEADDYLTGGPNYYNPTHILALNQGTYKPNYGSGKLKSGDTYHSTMGWIGKPRNAYDRTALKRIRKIGYSSDFFFIRPEKRPFTADDLMLMIFRLYKDRANTTDLSWSDSKGRERKMKYNIYNLPRYNRLRKKDPTLPAAFENTLNTRVADLIMNDKGIRTVYNMYNSAFTLLDAGLVESKRVTKACIHFILTVWAANKLTAAGLAAMQYSMHMRNIKLGRTAFAFSRADRLVDAGQVVRGKDMFLTPTQIWGVRAANFAATISEIGFGLTMAFSSVFCESIDLDPFSIDIGSRTYRLKDCLDLLDECISMLQQSIEQEEREELTRSQTLPVTQDQDSDSPTEEHEAQESNEEGENWAISQQMWEKIVEKLTLYDQLMQSFINHIIDTFTPRGKGQAAEYGFYAGGGPMEDINVKEQVHNFLLTEDLYNALKSPNTPLIFCKKILLEHLKEVREVQDKTMRSLEPLLSQKWVETMKSDNKGLKDYNKWRERYFNSLSITGVKGTIRDTRDVGPNFATMLNISFPDAAKTASGWCTELGLEDPLGEKRKAIPSGGKAPWDRGQRKNEQKVKDMKKIKIINEKVSLDFQGPGGNVIDRELDGNIGDSELDSSNIGAPLRYRDEDFQGGGPGGSTVEARPGDKMETAVEDILKKTTQIMLTLVTLGRNPDALKSFSGKNEIVLGAMRHFFPDKELYDPKKPILDPSLGPSTPSDEPSYRVTSQRPHDGETLYTPGHEELSLEPETGGPRERDARFIELIREMSDFLEPKKAKIPPKSKKRSSDHLFSVGSTSIADRKKLTPLSKQDLHNKVRIRQHRLHSVYIDNPSGGHGLRNNKDPIWYHRHRQRVVSRFGLRMQGGSIVIDQFRSSVAAEKTLWSLYKNPRKALEFYNRIIGGISVKKHLSKIDDHKYIEGFLKDPLDTLSKSLYHQGGSDALDPERPALALKLLLSYLYSPRNWRNPGNFQNSKFGPDPFGIYQMRRALENLKIKKIDTGPKADTSAVQDRFQETFHLRPRSAAKFDLSGGPFVHVIPKKLNKAMEAEIEKMRKTATGSNNRSTQTVAKYGKRGHTYHNTFRSWSTPWEYSGKGFLTFVTLQDFSLEALRGEVMAKSEKVYADQLRKFPKAAARIKKGRPREIAEIQSMLAGNYVFILPGRDEYFNSVITSGEFQAGIYNPEWLPSDSANLKNIGAYKGFNDFHWVEVNDRWSSWKTIIQKATWTQVANFQAIRWSLNYTGELFKHAFNKLKEFRADLEACVSKNDKISNVGQKMYCEELQKRIELYQSWCMGMMDACLHASQYIESHTGANFLQADTIPVSMEVSEISSILDLMEEISKKHKQISEAYYSEV